MNIRSKVYKYLDEEGVPFLYSWKWEDEDIDDESVDDEEFDDEEFDDEEFDDEEFDDEELKGISIEFKSLDDNRDISFPFFRFNLPFQLDEEAQRLFVYEYIFDTLNIKIENDQDLFNVKPSNGTPIIIHCLSPNYDDPKLSTGRFFIPLLKNIIPCDFKITKEITSLGGIHTIKGRLSIQSDVSSDFCFGELKQIEGDLMIFKNDNIKSLGKIRKVFGNIYIRGYGLQTLGKIEYVGGNISIRMTKVVSLGSLKELGGNLAVSRYNDHHYNYNKTIILGKIIRYKDPVPGVDSFITEKEKELENRVLVNKNYTPKNSTKFFLRFGGVAENLVDFISEDGWHYVSSNVIQNLNINFKCHKINEILDLYYLHLYDDFYELNFSEIKRVLNLIYDDFKKDSIIEGTFFHENTDDWIKGLRKEQQLNYYRDYALNNFISLSYNNNVISKKNLTSVRNMIKILRGWRSGVEFKISECYYPLSDWSYNRTIESSFMKFEYTLVLNPK